MALASRLTAAGRSGGIALLVRNKPGTPCILGVANFMTATGGTPLPQYGPKPFPYQDKKFTQIHMLWESPTRRFNENSKIIVIEGNIGSEKTKFAKRLAHEFSLHNMEPVSQDHIYKFPSYDYDLRELDTHMPEEAAYYDMQKFYQDKDHSHGRACLMQSDYFKLRWFQYSDAMLHLFSTGQGVVLPRSCYSDAVFCDTLLELGYIKKPAYNYITKVRQNAICDLWKPHLTIYLDTPVSKLMDNIKKRARPEELNSPVLTEQYLSTLEKNYKQKFLPEMRKSGEVLVYDHTEVDDEEDWWALIDDVERLLLDPVTGDDIKFADWARHFEDDFNEFRVVHQNKYKVHQRYFVRDAPYEAPEMLLSPEATTRWRELEEIHPFQSYAPGWNPNMGDSYLKLMFSLFSSKKEIGSDQRPGYMFRKYGISR